jgi:hypothetical protein
LVCSRFFAVVPRSADGALFHCHVDRHAAGIRLDLQGDGLVSQARYAPTS